MDGVAAFIGGRSGACHGRRREVFRQARLSFSGAIPFELVPQGFSIKKPLDAL
jgi:hypothetical protein